MGYRVDGLSNREFAQRILDGQKGSIFLEDRSKGLRLVRCFPGLSAPAVFVVWRQNARFLTIPAQWWKVATFDNVHAAVNLFNSLKGA